MKRIGVVGSLGLVALVVACSSAKTGSGFDSAQTNSGNASASGGSSGSSGTSGTGGDGPVLNTSDAGQSNGCPYHDATDHDGDGYSGNDGDCNDCDPNVNPGAYDTGKDEDCDGTPGDDGQACDQTVKLDSTDPFDGAKAMGLCKKADPNGTGVNKKWGVVAAQWVMPDGKPLTDVRGYGLLPKFGANDPKEGAAMVALSSGAARAPGQPGFSDPSGLDKGYTSGAPTGYPKESPSCPGVTTGQPHDGAGLQLTIRVPTNAKSFSFQENFFTYEFPNYICSEFNDFYVAIMTPKPAGLPDGNIAFDQQNNPISVNNSLLQVCKTQNAPPFALPPTTQKHFACPLGDASLGATAFETHAATGWLQTQAPVKGGDTITLLFTIWDSGDGVLDSTVLVDKFAWSADPGSGVQTQPAPAK